MDRARLSLLGAVALVAALVLVACGGFTAEPPVIDSILIEPAELHSNSVAFARVGARDPQGHLLSYTYQWTRNGEAIPGAVAERLDLALSGNGDGGDALAVRVSATGSARSKPVTSAAVAIAPAVKISASEAKTYYSVEGADSRAMFASILKNGPHDGPVSASGQAHFEFSRTVRTAQVGERCSLDIVTLTNATVLTLPKIAPASRPAALEEKAERFRESVVVHEEHHASIRREYLEKLAVTLRTVRPASTCAAVERDVEALVRSALDAEDREQSRFHDEEAVRVQKACTPIASQIAALASSMESLRSQPARYNALVPVYNGLVEDHNWCVKS